MVTEAKTPCRKGQECEREWVSVGRTAHIAPWGPMTSGWGNIDTRIQKASHTRLMSVDLALMATAGKYF